MSEIIRVRAPATSANIGPGFDCAGCALDLWNELVVTSGSGVVVEGEGEGEVPTDGSHLALQAFSALAPLDGWRFEFKNRIPLASGLGSSAATIALGVVAGLAVAGADLTTKELLQHALALEDHPDNIAPALLGGAVLAWHGGGACAVRRIAERMPLAPVIVIPPGRVSTCDARAALPAQVPFADAAHTVGRAAMLGASIATGDADLFVAALDDRLHEPYRRSLSPTYEALREALPDAARAVTISGSGPTVIAWCDDAATERCHAELADRFPDAAVLALAASPIGAELF